MARYIDADKLCKALENMASTQYPDKQNTILGIVSSIENFPAADVVPKSEVDNLELTLQGVMWFVDKWLDEADYDADPIKRAITMREKTVRIVEKLEQDNEDLQDVLNNITYEYLNCKAEVAREIFEEIEKYSEVALMNGRIDTPILCIGMGVLAELKKKYIGEQ